MKASLIAPLVLVLALPAAAQERRSAPSAPGGGGGGGATNGGGGGGNAGSTASSGGGSASSGGGGGGSAAPSGFSGGGSSGGRVSPGGQHSATGGSGVAVPRNSERGQSAGSGGRRSDGGANGGGSDARGAGAGTPRSSAPSTPSTPSGAQGQGQAIGRREAAPRDAAAPANGASGVPAHARPRDHDEPIVGTAVPRGSVPVTNRGGGTTIISSGFYPWWFGGVGAGYYSGYYGGYYDPWFGGYPDPGPVVYSGRYQDEGTLRLKVKPREAEVFVDGYYVGVVDDFDGMFQKLHLETGPHRIEVRAEGFEPLSFDVRISPDHNTTYQGEMKKIQ